ncbi:MAG: hypothetical protein QOG42_168, partial [Solirubrobacteraceae bacterium]|nr:hypothetical protein [Solirubrobacteraceae bacterium]
MRYAQVRSLRRGALRGVCAAVAVATSLALAAPAGAIQRPTLEDQGGEVTVQGLLAFDRSGTVTPAAPFLWTGSVGSGQNI